MTTIAFLADARCSKYGASGIIELTKDLDQIIPLSPTGLVDGICFAGDMDRIAQTIASIAASTMKNIPVYYTLGNHEVGSTADIDAIRASHTNFHLNCSFDLGDVHICITNQYWDGGSNDAYFKYGGDDGAYIHPNLYNWVNTDLSNTSKPWKVVMGHEPLYPVGNHVGDSLDRDVANRDSFQALMALRHVAVFVCSHTHYAGILKMGTIFHVNAGNCGLQAGGSGQDNFASIMYAHTDGNDLVITWKKENPTWSYPSVLTYRIVGGVTPTPTPIPPEIPVCGFSITQVV